MRTRKLSQAKVDQRKDLELKLRNLHPGDETGTRTVLEEGSLAIERTVNRMEVKVTLKMVTLLKEKIVNQSLKEVK